MNRKYPPLAADHPLVGQVCKTCQKPFAAGDATTLINPRPDNPEDAARAAAGKAYTARVDPAHWDCWHRIDWGEAYSYARSMVLTDRWLLGDNRSPAQSAAAHAIALAAAAESVELEPGELLAAAVAGLRAGRFT